ncbi:MAG: arylsulfatase [Mucilaginibacter polytrichastri]|nr:arylsulfatase [Mucilaginibacter polytrichastri]
MRTAAVVCMSVTLLIFRNTLSAQERPNVLVIYADDLGYGDLSCYGMTRIKTPNIDALAKQGVRFSNAHSTSATCTPSRFGLLTGRYPWRQTGTGIAPGNASLIIPTGKATAATVMQQAGYRTAAIGKWHLGLGGADGPDWNGLLAPGPKEVGFDYSFLMPATLDRVPCVYVENGRVVNLDPADPIQVDYTKPVGNWPTGAAHPELLKLKNSPGHGHDNTIVDSIGRIGWMTGGRAALWRDENIAATITEKAKKFMGEKGTQPFFLYYASGDIHVPRYPHSRFRGKSGMGLRGDAILQLDWAVGELTRTLDSLGIRKNTLIILTSDNGPVLDDGYADEAVRLAGDHKPAGPLRGGKYSNFDAGTRVPFIVSWPEKIQGENSSSALVSQIDLTSTLAQLTGQHIPAGSAPDSFAQLPAWLGGNDGRDYVIEDAGSLSIIRGLWKYIAPSAGKAYAPLTRTELGNAREAQLYNLERDAGERKNEAKAHPDLTLSLERLLEEVKSAR